MVYHDVAAYLRQWWRPEEGSWIRVAQILVGMFFLSAAIYKTNNYFIIGDQSLSVHFGFWIEYNWVPEFYKPWLMFMQEHHKVFAAFTIFLQGVPGLCLIANWHPRKAAAVLLFVQLNIFLATYERRSFFEFTSTSLWVSTFYLLKPSNPKDWPKWLWQLMTLGLVYIAGFKLWSNYDYGYLENAVRENFMNLYQTDVVAMHLGLKQLYIAIFVTSPLGAYFWYGLWYARFIALVLMFHTWRSAAATFQLLYWIGVVLTWSNLGGTEGTFWTLMFFAWLTQNQLLERCESFKNSPGLLKLCRAKFTST